MSEQYFAVHDGTLYLEHHGIKGQKWGVRRFQNKNGSLTAVGRKRLGYSAKSVGKAVVAGGKKVFNTGVSVGKKTAGAVKEHTKKVKDKRLADKKEKASQTREGVLKNKKLFSNQELKDLEARFKVEDEMRNAKMNQGIAMAKSISQYAETVTKVANAVQTGGKAVQEISKGMDAMSFKKKAESKGLTAEEYRSAIDKGYLADKLTKEANAESTSKEKKEKKDKSSASDYTEKKSDSDDSSDKGVFKEHKDVGKGSSDPTEPKTFEEHSMSDAQKASKAKKQAIMESVAAKKAKKEWDEKLDAVRAENHERKVLQEVNERKKRYNQSVQKNRENEADATALEATRAGNRLKAAQKKLKAFKKTQRDDDGNFDKNKLSPADRTEYESLVGNIISERIAESRAWKLYDAQHAVAVTAKREGIKIFKHYAIMDEEEYLEHYGVKGMKWGSHKMAGKGEKSDNAGGGGGGNPFGIDEEAFYKATGGSPFGFKEQREEYLKKAKEAEDTAKYLHKESERYAREGNRKMSKRFEKEAKKKDREAEAYKRKAESSGNPFKEKFGGLFKPKTKEKVAHYIDESGTLYLQHFGVKGMKWGVRRFQNEDGTLTDKGRKHYTKKLESIKRQQVASDATRGQLERSHKFAVTSAAVVSGAQAAIVLGAYLANPPAVAAGIAITSLIGGGVTHVSYKAAEVWEGRGTKKRTKKMTELNEKLQQDAFVVDGVLYLQHFGLKGMKWGQRRFQNADGSLTSAGKARYGKAVETTGGGGGGVPEDEEDEEKKILEKIADAAKKAGMTPEAYYKKHYKEIWEAKREHFSAKDDKNHWDQAKVANYGEKLNHLPAEKNNYKKHKGARATFENITGIGLKNRAERFARNAEAQARASAAAYDYESKHTDSRKDIKKWRDARFKGDYNSELRDENQLKAKAAKYRYDRSISGRVDKAKEALKIKPGEAKKAAAETVKKTKKKIYNAAGGKYKEAAVKDRQDAARYAQEAQSHANNANAWKAKARYIEKNRPQQDRGLYRRISSDFTKEKKRAEERRETSILKAKTKERIYEKSLAGRIEKAKKAKKRSPGKKRVG